MLNNVGRGNNNRLTLILIGVLVVVGIVVGNFVLSTKSQGNTLGLSVPQTDQNEAQSSPIPEVPAYNPPKEFKYDSSTDLDEVLESINPQVLNNDFDDIKTLIESL